MLALGIGVALWLFALVVTARLGEASTHSAGSGFALPARGVVLIGVLCFLAMTTEGAIGDWSGIYLREDLGSSSAAAATGFAGFSLGMAIARLGGDWVNERLGAGLLLRGGMTLVALALGARAAGRRADPGRGRLRARRASGSPTPCRSSSAPPAATSRRARRCRRSSPSATRASSSARR